MNTILSTTGHWAASGSLLFASATLLGTVAGAKPLGSEGGTPSQPVLAEAEMATSGSFDDLQDALKGGKFWVNLRYRFETVDQDGFAKDAVASTLRTRLGYETGEYNDFSGLLEFSDVTRIDNGATNYNDLVNGRTTYPVVADPKLTVVNQAYVKYGGLWDGDLKVGRQRLKLDNDRFIGNVGWRQTEQVFDAVTYVKPDLAGIKLVYSFIGNVNNTRGQNQPSESHVLNISHEFENVGRLTAYGYYLDIDLDFLGPALRDVFSTASFGVRFAGEREFEDNQWALLYTAEIAQQIDVGSNPQTDTNANYLHVNVGGKVSGFTGKIGWEKLGGDTDPNGASFQTPLATLFKFNGWADQFLINPQNGLRDLYFEVGYEYEQVGLAVIYHDFMRDKGSGPDYGNEVDLRATYETPWAFDIGLQYANFDADSAAAQVDTQKFWVWLYYSF